ncbi:protein phosphatase 2C domain-containing protein [Rhizohabitans arisaemae]|uniref:protein phosphatase 2C domain-containing protein n=1 Tax=Rhizohabitans arisaemae TaxID=2720610 RepID=UPI0024B0DDBD|nr:protein phosphatase 2C domain-containing protein [Rhizohabitans arisaemae]
MEIALVVILAIISSVLGVWSMQMRAQLKRLPQVVKEPVYIDRPVRVEIPVQTEDRVVYQEAAEPEIPIGHPGEAEHLLDPQVLPDVPDSVPDSVADAARLGALAARAVSVRGHAARVAAKVRRQTVALAVLDRFQPPVLLSAVAAGRPTGRHTQVGAAQACRSIQHKLTDRAYEIDAAWKDLESGDRGAEARLAELFASACASLYDPLAEAARRRDLPSDALATELTCVLTRLGDGPSRRHLAFGVGSGPVAVLQPDGEWTTVFSPRTDNAVVLPAESPTTRWGSFAVAPGGVVFVSTASTALFLERARASMTEEWLQAPPHLTRFLWQINQPDQANRDDRSVVALWELRG